MSVKVKVGATFTPPSDPNFLGVHGYLEAPDFSSGPEMVVDTTVVNNKIVQGQLIDLGILYNNVVDSAGNITLYFNTHVLNFPTSPQQWRLYLQSVGTNYDPVIVPANQPSPTPSIVFTVSPPPTGGIGQEYAPLVTGVSIDPRGFQRLNVLTKTRRSPNGWECAPFVLWDDPTIDNNPDRIQEYQGADVELIQFDDGIDDLDDPMGFARFTYKNHVAFRKSVNVGVGELTCDYIPVPGKQIVYAVDVLSEGLDGVNTFSPGITPQGYWITPDLDQLRQRGGDGVLAPGTGSGTQAPALADFEQFNAEAFYDYGPDGQYALVIVPSFKYPDGDYSPLSSGILVARAPFDGDFYNAISIAEYGDKRTSDWAEINRSDGPEVAERWEMILVSRDSDGNSKYPDADNLRDLTTAPDFGTSPRVTITIPARVNPPGGGDEIGPSVTLTGGGVFYDTLSESGGERFGFQGSWLTLDDPRVQSVAAIVVYDGDPSNPRDLGKKPKDDQKLSFGSWPVNDGTVSGVLYFVSENANGGRNSIVRGVTPGVGFTIQPQTTGSLKLHRADLSTVNTSHFQKNSSTGKFEVKPNAIGSTELAAGAISDQSKFGGTIRGQESVTSLPSLPSSSYPLNSTVVYNHKLYRSTGSTWDTSVAGADITADTAFINLVQAVNIIASQVSATTFTGQTFNGLSLQLALNGATGYFANTTDPSGGAGVRVVDNTNGEYSSLTQQGLRVYPSTGSSLIDLSSPAPTYAPQLKLANPTAGTLMVLRPNSLNFSGVQVLGTRQTDPGNSTGSSDIVSKFNSLLTALRNHGIIG